MVITLSITQIIMLSLLFAILVWLFFAFCYAGHLVYNQGLRLFLDTEAFFIGNVSQPGGLGEYIAIFLTQFNYWPLLGAAIIAVILGGIHFLLTLYIRKHGFWRVWEICSLAVPFALWILLCRKGASISPAIGILAAVALSFIHFDRKVVTGVWAVIMAAALYLGFGPVSAASFIALQVSALVPSGGRKVRRAAARPGSHRRSPHPKKFIGYAAAVAIFAGGLSGVFKVADIGLDMDMRYTQAARNRDWARLIGYSQNKHLKKSVTMCNCVNLALANTLDQNGKALLSSYALHSSEFGTGSLMLGEQYDQINACEILFNLGFISEARRCAFERLTSVSEDGYSGYWISRLAECALIDGNYELARRYLSILSRNFIYGYSARKLMQMSEEDIDGHFLYGRLRKMRMTQNVSFQERGLDFMLLAMLNDHSDNQMAMDYYVAFLNISNNE